MSSSPSKIDSPQARQALQTIADAKGFIELPDFVRFALFDPTFGYYQKDKTRVGRSAKSDFFTASSLREAFAAIAIEASVSLLQQKGLEPKETVWVEIGAEPGAALLEGRDHPFKATQTLSLGVPLALAGQLVVFSNELFDAQPFRQLRFENGSWVEYGIRLNDGAIEWAPRPSLHDELLPFSNQLPTPHHENYLIDLPTGAAQLAETILQQDWQGVFLALDYGKTWQQLVQETPRGTARSYYQHQLGDDILERVGEQDITHHVCWDHLQEILQKHRFDAPLLQSQESFVVRQAPRFMAKAFDPGRSSLDPLRTQLKELIHPALMGQKFQALSATRLHSSPS